VSVEIFAAELDLAAHELIGTIYVQPLPVVSCNLRASKGSSACSAGRSVLVAFQSEIIRRPRAAANTVTA